MQYTIFPFCHDQQSVNNAIFDFQKELVEYCESDVKLLKQGCLKFKGLFEEKSKFNPICCMTIASACNRDRTEWSLIPSPMNPCMDGECNLITPKPVWNGSTGRTTICRSSQVLHLYRYEFSTQPTRVSNVFRTAVTPLMVTIP